MATLILEHDGKRKAAVLNGRVVIGRRANSHIVVPDRTVSRIHAWIGQNAGAYFIVDSGSRVGTLVNGQALKGRHSLADGDQIRVGSAVLTFHSNGSLPADAEEIDLAARVRSADDGIFLDCSCGAPLWAPWDFAGRLGQCRYCGQMVELPPRVGGMGISDPSADTIYPGGPGIDASSSPAPSATPKYRGISISPGHQPTRTIKPSIFDAPTPPPAPPKPPAPEPQIATEPQVLCGACQSEISPDEQTAECGDCGVKFHADCWIENRGCSSYGCKQVGALDPKPAPSTLFDAAPPESDALDFEPPAPPVAMPTDPAIEWDYLALPLALVTALVGLITFGIPALIAGTLLYLYQRRGSALSHPQMLMGSIALCAFATVCGFVLSWFWWISVGA
ncbi:MAG TPA: FHA domain-containing protein [Tepidisphaeraceae bacterium]|jgi:hypothetical protein